MELLQMQGKTRSCARSGGRFTAKDTMVAVHNCCDPALMGLLQLQGKACSCAKGSGRSTAKCTMVVVCMGYDPALTGLLQLQGKARSCAKDVGVNPHEVEAVLGHVPPQVDVSRGPLEAAQWFNSRWLAAVVKGERPACR